MIIGQERPLYDLFTFLMVTVSVMLNHGDESNFCDQMFLSSYFSSNIKYFTSAWMSSPWSSSVVICQLPDQVSKSLKYTNVLWESSLFIELEVRKGFRSKMLTFLILWRGG